MNGAPGDPAGPGQRQRLHEAYASTARLLDASQLAYLGTHRPWSLEQVRDAWAQVPTATPRPAVNHVYVHVPFCKSICHFCNYERLRPSSPTLMRQWLTRLCRTLEALKPGLQLHTFHTLYIGGGTPSVLPAPMLDELLDALEAAIPLHPLASRQFELDPAVMDRQRIQRLKRRGFYHFSMGIQTLDPEVNRAHGRGSQGPEIVAERFRDFDHEGIDSVSCDFLLGLRGTTPQSILDEIRFVLERFAPRGVDVYRLVPTPMYEARHFGGSSESFREHLGPFERDLATPLARIASNAGYRLGPGKHHGYALRRRPRLADLLHWERRLRDWSPFRYTQLVSDQRRPLSLLGLGPSARSLLFGCAQIEYRDPGEADGQAPRFVGRRIDLKGEARTYLVHRLRDADHVSRSEFRALFRGDVTEMFGETIAAWRESGTARITPARLELRPEDHGGRLRTLLHLVDPRDIQAEISRHRGARV